ncbi:MAG: TIGR01458 family HAD-type hydrolase [candidate division Zixibacteria bacterium]|nr:TIGR01458 family HAD-type hydrolase [candidate division Zixibacteria bacterium]
MAQLPEKDIRGLLIDLDGVMYVGDHPVAGAVSAIEYLWERAIPFRFTTNTTTKSLESLRLKLNRLGVPAESHEIFGVIQVAQSLLRSKGDPTCLFLLTEDPLSDFSEFRTDDEKPDVIVVGDIGKVWDYRLMNRLCRMVMNGSELIALHKGRYWQTENGLRVDIGAFVAGIEYVTGVEARVVGKPLAEFFGLAVDSMGLERSQVAMIGDDIESDVGGAQRAGMLGVLVKTGKYRAEIAA